MKLQFKKLHEAAQLPRRQSSRAAGYDLHTVQKWTLSPGEQFCFPTGVAVAIPEGHYGRVAPRSGLAAKKKINVHAGVIDSDYRGELLVLLINHSDDWVEINKGDRIAQLIIEKIATPDSEWADELPETVRGAGGFGSSGI